MKLSRVYKKCAEFSVSADITNGNINEAKAIKTTELTFGYSYVVDAKGNPYPGKNGDCYASVDVYSNDEYVMGIIVQHVEYFKQILNLYMKDDIGMAALGKYYAKDDICRGAIRMQIWLRSNTKDHIAYDFWMFIENYDKVRKESISILGGELGLSVEQATAFVTALEYCSKLVMKELNIDSFSAIHK